LSSPPVASSKIFSKWVSLHHIKIFSKREEKIKIGRPPERGKEVPYEDSKSYTRKEMSKALRRK